MNNTNINKESTCLIPFKKENFGWIFTGLTQSDGSFAISIIKTKSKIGLVLRPFFSIELKDSSINILLEVQQYLGGCGRIYNNKIKKTVNFEISDFPSIWHILIPHFLKYPLESSKLESFLKFTNCMIFLFPFYNKNKPADLLLDLIKYSYFMNEGTGRTEEDFKDVIYNYFNKGNPNLALDLSTSIVFKEKSQLWLDHIKTKFLNSSEIELNTILGIIEGDGSFYISFTSDFKIKFGFNITTSIKDLYTLYKIKWRLGCGKVYIKSETWCRFEVTRKDDLINIIEPLIKTLELYRGNNVRLLSSKSQSFEACTEALALYTKGLVNTSNEKKNFITKYYNMYEAGSKRKKTLKEYLDAFSLNNLK